MPLLSVKEKPVGNRQRPERGEGVSSLYVSMWGLASGEQLECPPRRGRGLEFRSSIAKFSLR
jgi:hypothetical protein